MESSSAAEALAASRQAWLEDLARWNQSRRDAKACGRRQPAIHERYVYLSRRWPGGEHTTDPRARLSGDDVVSVGFLATYGVVPTSAIEQWQSYQNLATLTLAERRGPRVGMLVWAAIAAAVIAVLVLSTIRGSRIDSTTLFVAPSSVVFAILLHHTASWALSRRRRRRPNQG